MMKKSLLALALLCVSACAATTPVDIPGDGAQLEARQIQSRQYDTLDKTLTVRSVVATLQDLGFTIDQADADLGTITGTRYDKYIMRMTVTVVQRGDTNVSVRANARVAENSVSDAATYQDFFVVLDKAMFLTLQGVD
jgi:hypothetical protein